MSESTSSLSAITLHHNSASTYEGIDAAQWDRRFLNRELSWLDFNARVLACAADPSIPLLERAKFLAIFSSNLDEFYMVRVAGLKRREQTGLGVLSADGLSPREQLGRITKKTQELCTQQSEIFLNDIIPGLRNKGVSIARWDELSDYQRERLSKYFYEQIFPVLTPLAVDPSHPFPYISGLSVNLAIIVSDPEGAEYFARLKVPDNVNRFIRVHLEDGYSQEKHKTPAEADAHCTFLPIEFLIAAHLTELFPGMVVVDYHAFRVTRNADFEVDEDRDEDLLQALERELARRRFGAAVRLEITDQMTSKMRTILERELDVHPADVIVVSGLLDLSALFQLGSLERPELKDRPFVPLTHPAFAEKEVPKSIFSTLREGDVLVHHPYQSFSTSVQRFIEQAATDPKVLAIKQTLYRTSGDSPIVNALISAAEAGKQVAALVEIKARFDEQANIAWARKLEKAGVHVAYGLVGLKTHCKVCLVVRREGAKLIRYCHIGTGNYNPKTARLYEDIGFFTAESDIGADLTDLFNTLTGYSYKKNYDNILVAPHGIRAGIIERIDEEIHAQRRGELAGIDIKANSLVDEQVIDALYRASTVGVKIRCVVRGICALRPEVPGLSENITVHSILGRFLEHSRIFHFHATDQYWIGSADMMHRNLDRRIEILAQIRDTRLTDHLAHTFTLAFEPSIRCWKLDSHGTWTLTTDDPNALDYQDVMTRYYS